MAVPWHSVDSTNWEIGPCAFGRWQKFGALSVRGSNQDLRCEVKFYLDLEAKARVRWKKEMKELAALDDSAAPAVQLAQNGPQMSKRGEEHVLAKYGPKVRLAWSIAAAPVRTLAELGKDFSIEARGDAVPERTLKVKSKAAAKAAAAKPAKVQVETKPKRSKEEEEQYWIEYWKKRGLKRDESNLPQI